MATPAAQAHRDGDTRVINGVTYTRTGGSWVPAPRAAVPGVGSAPAGVELVPLAPPDPARAATEARAQAAEERAQRSESRADEAQHRADQSQERTSQHQTFEDEATLANRFRQEPPVRTYEQILPTYYALMHDTPDSRAGDLSLVYGTASLLDPGSVVRESESVMVNNTATLPQEMLGAIRTLNGGGRLTPETRRQIQDMLETRGAALAQNYNRIRTDYENRAQHYGFDPNAVIGIHPALPYRQRLEQRQNAARDNMVGYVPWAHRAPPQVDNPLSPEQQGLYDQYMRTNPRATPEQLTQFFAGMGMTIHNAPDIVRARDQGGGIQPGERARFQPPDISDVRGQGGAIETSDAFMRSAANAPTLGAADYLSAGIDAATTDRTFGESLRREHAIDAYDFGNHPIASVAGSVAGSALLPTGALNEARTAATITMRSGLGREAALEAARGAAARRLATEGGFYGGVSGALNSDGDLQNRVATTAIDTALGASGGYFLSRFAPQSAFGGRRMAPAAQRPALVDPATERINSPLEGVTPAERISAADQFGINLPMGAAGGRTAAIIEKGLDIVPGSAGVMEDSRTGLRGEVAQAAEGVASRYGSSQTLYSGGQSAQRGARDWISRFDRVSGTAYEAIPIPSEGPAKVSNTRTALGRLTTIFPSNPEMAQIFRNARLERLASALDPQAGDELLRAADALESAARSLDPSVRTAGPRAGGLSWEDLKDLRSRVGYEIGEQRFSDSPTRDELRSLYAALSEDMRATAHANGPRALRAFERANNLYREGQDRIDNALVAILGDNSRNNPEAAARAIQTIARSGRGTSNIDQLTNISRSLRKNGEWDEVASSLIRLMGQPTNSAGREFSPGTFVQSYADMSEQARNILFGGGGRRAELRAALDDFTAVMQRLAGTNALRNTSNTAPGITAAGTVTTAASALVNPMIALKLAAVGAGTNVMARAWTNPRFVRWATRYARTSSGAASGRRGPEELARLRSRLAAIGRSDPAITVELSDLDRQLFGEGD